MPKFVIEREIAGAGKLSLQDLYPKQESFHVEEDDRVGLTIST